MDPSFIAEMTGAFLDEAEEQLHTIDQEILKLEQAGESTETIQSLFRAAHTLKGSSAAMGLEEMAQLTHEMEHLLDLVRNRRLPVTKTMINRLFKCQDQLKLIKDQFAAGTGISVEIGPLVEELKRFAANPEGEHLPEPTEAEREIRSLSVGSAETGMPLRDGTAQISNVHEIQLRLAADCQMKLARAWIVLRQLEAWGDVLLTVPALDSPEGLEDEALERIRFVLDSQADPAEVKSALLGIMDVAEVRIAPFAPSEADGGTDILAETAAESQPFPVPQREEKRAPNLEEGKRKIQTIRVDVERLEHLMNLVGELVIDQTRINQVGSLLRRSYASDGNVDELGQISDHVSRVIGELQESVMKVRMLPIEQLFNRFPRMIRDLAEALNKEIDLLIEGRETELDRTVIEEIGDPLIHLIRNAVDHGIESAEERIRKGKPAKGRLRITAAHEENQVIITVEDDGGGIDPAQIRNSALRKGVITEEEARRLSDQEAVYLIFRPGFSTASAVSEISGRGVGMDIVRNHIEKLSGVIDIETRPGEGTRIKIKLPLTLAIITGLLVKLGGSTFILPMSSVVEIVRTPPEAIQTVMGDSVIVLRERVLPIVRLHDEFRFPRARQQKKQLPIVVVGTAEKRVALVVDELIGNQEIVVKSLGAFVGKVDCISGATILGDGRVALILEVAGIVRLSRHAV